VIADRTAYTAYGRLYLQTIKPVSVTSLRTDGSLYARSDSTGRVYERTSHTNYLLYSSVTIERDRPTFSSLRTSVNNIT